MQANNSIPYDFINSFDEIILFLSSNFTIQALNISAEKIFATKANFIIGQSFSIFCPNFDNNTQKFLSGSMTSCIGDNVITWRSISYTYPKNSIKFMLIGYKEKKSNLLPQKNDPSKKIDVSTYEDIKNLNQTLTGNPVNQEKDTLEHVKDIYHYMENIIAEIPVSVYWMNKECVYLGCSNSMAKLLNLASRHDIIGKTYADLYDEKSSECYRIADKKVMDTGVSLSAEEPLYSSDGTKKIFLSNKVPLRDSSGEIIGMLGISVDITTQKNMEEDLKKAKEAAEMASFYKTEFIANMSHDIRTPLSGVVGRGEQLEKEMKNTNHRNIVHNMVRSSYALLDMLNEILDAVSIGNTSVEDIHEEPFDLPHLVQRIIDLEQSSVDLKKIELLTSIDKKLPTILLGDHKKVHHIILNLVGNAIKFTKHGHVDINIKLLERNNEAVQVLFEITDTGVGISPENLGKVFELFYKITPSHKGLDKGHGIGLHIVKTYTELLGGKITVESKLNEGSKFSFNLTFKIPDKNAIPLNITQASLADGDDERLIINSAQTMKVTSSVLEIGLNAPRILIIEDDDDLRMITENMTNAAHCSSMTANDGETGLELAKSQAFDFILADIGLPGISGIEFAKLLRQYEKDNNKNPVPIIAVTGHGQTVQKECLEAGINQIIIKPIKLQTLTELCTKFAFFVEKQQDSPRFDQPALQPVTQKQGLLGPDLPNTEAELFEIDNLPIFDMENAQKILGDNTTLLMKVLNNSINITTPKELGCIKKAHEDNDWIKVADIVHKLKGTYLSLSLTRLGITCQYLERYHQAGQTALLEKLYQQFINVLEITVQQLKPWIE